MLLPLGPVNSLSSGFEEFRFDSFFENELVVERAFYTISNRRRRERTDALAESKPRKVKL
jgi:hypothetical protein